MEYKMQIILWYLLFSRKKCKTVIIVKNRISTPGGLFRKIAFTPGGLIERGRYSKLGAYSIIYGTKVSKAYNFC